MSKQSRNEEELKKLNESLELSESTSYRQSDFSLASSSDKSIDLAKMNGASQNNSTKTDQNSKKE